MTRPNESVAFVIPCHIQPYSTMPQCLGKFQDLLCRWSTCQSHSCRIPKLQPEIPTKSCARHHRHQQKLRPHETGQIGKLLWTCLNMFELYLQADLQLYNLYVHITRIHHWKKETSNPQPLPYQQLNNSDGFPQKWGAIPGKTPTVSPVTGKIWGCTAWISPRYRAKLVPSPSAASHSTFLRPSSCPVNLSRNLLLTLGILESPTPSSTVT